MPILPEVCERLKLAPMVEANTSPLGTSFTVPVDHTELARPASPPRSGPARSRRSSTRPASRPTSSARATCFRWWPRKGACCAAPATPRPRSTWRGWPAWRRPACCARSSDPTATGPPATALFELAARAQAGDHLDRRADPLSPRPREAGLSHHRGPTADAARPVQDDLLRREVRSPAAVRAGDGRTGQRPPCRWCGCTRPASPATCSARCAAIAAISCTWPWR